MRAYRYLPLVALTAVSVSATALAASPVGGPTSKVEPRLETHGGATSGSEPRRAGGNSLFSSAKLTRVAERMRPARPADDERAKSVAPGAVETHRQVAAAAVAPRHEPAAFVRDERPVVQGYRDEWAKAVSESHSASYRFRWVNDAWSQPTAVLLRRARADLETLERTFDDDERRATSIGKKIERFERSLGRASSADKPYLAEHLTQLRDELGKLAGQREGLETSIADATLRLHVFEEESLTARSRR